MDIRLKNGEQVLDGRGLPETVRGEEALLQQALIRLTVRKGSFPQDPALGSRLHELRRSGVARLEQLALGYAQDALAPMTGVRVQEVLCRYDQGADRLEMELTLWVEGKSRRLAVEIGG